MLGSLMTFASGVFTNSPRAARSSSWRCSSVRYSGKVAMMRPASEMSRVPMVTPAGAAKARMIGSREAEASSGASSTLVYTISGVCLSAMFLLPFAIFGRSGLERRGVGWTVGHPGGARGQAEAPGCGGVPQIPRGWAGEGKFAEPCHAGFRAISRAPRSWLAGEGALPPSRRGRDLPREYLRQGEARGQRERRPAPHPWQPGRDLWPKCGAPFRTPGRR